MVKKKLLISFSGGRTSAYMMWWLLNKWEDRHEYEIKVVFANTGLEDPGTLAFVHECSWRWGIDIVWVEARLKNDEGALFSKKGWKVKAQVVDYFRAARCQKLIDGTWAWTPFEEMISVLGIPSTNAPFCSTVLKNRTIKSYMRSLGIRDYYTAIGIRVDEIDRVSDNYLANRIIYPFIQMVPTRRSDVFAWWGKQTFDLQIDPDDGNCDNCWKKDMDKLVRNARRRPESFGWWQYITEKYGHINPRSTNLKPPFNFYRGNKSPAEILEMAKLSDDQLVFMYSEEKLNGCGESCEAF